MKNSILLFTVLVFFSFGCNRKKDKFKGLWMAFKVENMRLDNLSGTINGMRISDYRGKGHGIDSFVDMEDYRLFSFEKEGVLFDDGDIFGQNLGTWKLTNNTKKLTLNSIRGNEVFDILKIKDNAIVMKRQYEKSKDSILYTLVPFENMDATECKKAFQYLMTKPKQTETEDKIKERLKHALKFYAYYFENMTKDAQVNSFKPLRIHLPLQFYSGGIGLKSFETNPDWQYLFFNTQDAAKAYEHLNLALKKVGVFPNRGRQFALEYAEVLNEMAGYL
jgi:hypothetical protein